MDSSERARALAGYVRSRVPIEGSGLHVPGSAAEVLSRARRLGIESGGGRDAAVGTMATLADVRREAEACIRCGLHTTRRSVVFSDGPDRARVMCVGEAPGAREDEMGLPFVGRAGQLLDRLLLSVGFAREEVYICNVLKCRPPGNRNPEPEEIELCSPFLRRQVALVQPEVVIAFGTFAARTLLGVRDSLGRMRGRVHEYEGVPLIVTYHPAALLRNPHWKRPSWEDLQLVRRTLAENRGG